MGRILEYPVVDDLRQLWRTRKSSGFPWPFQRGIGSRRHYARSLITGHSFYSAVPLRRQLLSIPLRPWRYAKTVREIARVRNLPYSKYDQDDVA